MKLKNLVATWMNDITSLPFIPHPSSNQIKYGYNFWVSCKPTSDESPNLRILQWWTWFSSSFIVSSSSSFFFICSSSKHKIRHFLWIAKAPILNVQIKNGPSSKLFISLSNITYPKFRTIEDFRHLTTFPRWTWSWIPFLLYSTQIYSLLNINLQCYDARVPSLKLFPNCIP